MGTELKKDFLKLAREAEISLTKSILKWRFEKEGKQPPEEQDLDKKSREVSDQVNRIISDGARSLWDEIKKAYKDRKKEEK